jgi:hypothetical protein
MKWMTVATGLTSLSLMLLSIANSHQRSAASRIRPLTACEMADSRIGQGPVCYQDATVVSCGLPSNQIGTCADDGHCTRHDPDYGHLNAYYTCDDNNHRYSQNLGNTYRPMCTMVAEGNFNCQYQSVVCAVNQQCTQYCSKKVMDVWVCDSMSLSPDTVLSYTSNAGGCAPNNP